MSVQAADQAEIRDGAGSVAWLLSHGFRLIGAWNGSMPRIHRAPFLHRQAGIYAFVVEDRTAYIGMASELHSRLRNYRNRILRPKESRPFRKAHKGVATTISAGRAVAVYVLPIALESDRTLVQVEAELIRRAKPEWNGSGHERSRVSSTDTSPPPLGSAVTEAANRAEVTALLIRCGYRVYRSEADIDGEDMVVMAPGGHLRRVQLKGRPYVEWRRYGGQVLWMLFPSAPWRPDVTRTWFLVPHDTFFAWVKVRHGHTPKWGDAWSYPTTGKDLAAYLAEWAVKPPVVTAES